MLATPKRSARPNKILQAACKLFARHGYHATSTREIAHLADVGENTIFRHFINKEGLFWATLDAQFDQLQLPRELLGGLEQCKPPELFLPGLLGLLTDTIDFRPELLRLIIVAFLELPERMAGVCRQRLSPFFSAINHYFEMNITTGKIRDLDPGILTSTLITTVLLQSSISSLIEGDKLTYPNREKARNAHALFWLDVVAPRMLADSSQDISRISAERGLIAGSLPKVEHP